MFHAWLQLTLEGPRRCVASGLRHAFMGGPLRSANKPGVARARTKGKGRVPGSISPFKAQSTGQNHSPDVVQDPSFDGSWGFPKLKDQCIFLGSLAPLIRGGREADLLPLTAKPHVAA